jgi:uncharacterized protein (DUF58 family)
VTTRFRPTGGAVTLLGGAVFVYTLGRLLGDAWLLFAACTLGALPVVAGVLTPRLNRLHVHVQRPTRTRAGEPFTLRLTLMTDGRRTPDVRMSVVSTAFAPRTVLLPMAADVDRVTAQVETVAPTRGRWEDPKTVIVARTSSPWGLWRSEAYLVMKPGLFLVRPAAAPPTPATLAGTGQSSQPAGRPGQGLDVYGVRDWQSGDDRSKVHWRTSARRGQLMVLEREQHLSRALLVVVTAGRDVVTTETALAQACETAVRHAQAGDPVRLVAATASPSTNATPIAVGDWFAGVVPAGEPAPALLRMLSRGAAAVVWVGSPPSRAAAAVLGRIPLVVADGSAA